MDVEQELDRLYEAPLAEFVAKRNELAKQLRAEGEREAAARVKALAKPSLTAWAVNQLAFTAPAELEALTAAGSRVRAAHLASTKEQQAASGARRDAILRLVEIAEGILQDAGRPASRGHLHKIRLTLEVLSTQSPGEGSDVAGRLSKDLETSGFDAIADLAAALGQAQAQRPAKTATPAKVIELSRKAEPRAAKEPAQSTSPTPEPSEKARPKAPLEPVESPGQVARRLALRRRLEKAQNNVSTLEAKILKFQPRAEQARRNFEEGEREAQEASALARAAESAAREARAKAEAAEKKAGKARIELDAAQAALTRVEDQLASAHEELDQASAQQGASDP